MVMSDNLQIVTLVTGNDFLTNIYFFLKFNGIIYSKSPRIRTYFFESQAEIGSCFKGTKTNFKVQRFLFEGCLMQSLDRFTKMLSPIICLESILMDLLSNWG